MMYLTVSHPALRLMQKSKGKGVNSIRGGMSDLATSYFASMGVRTLMPHNEKKYRASMEVNMDTVMLGSAPPETSSNGKRRIFYGLLAVESILLVFSVAASRLVSAECHRLAFTIVLPASLLPACLLAQRLQKQKTRRRRRRTASSALRAPRRQRCRTSQN